MDGLMMDFPLTIAALVRHAERLHGDVEIVTRLPDRSLRRLTYADVIRRARKLATALKALGVERGDRVATFCWNHHQHLEVYFGVPSIGAVVHTLNIRLFPDDIAYIANHAADRVLIVDHALLPLLEKFRAQLTTVEHVIVVEPLGPVPEGMLEYEALIADAEPDPFAEAIDERDAAAMCYTSGTTGQPKGVVYSHRSQVLHTLAFNQACVGGLTERDVVMPAVPMFHANAWGVPYTAIAAGAKLVQVGPHLDGTSLLELLAGERVTRAFGVPTIWLALLQVLDRAPGAYDLSALESMLVGGAAVPESMIRAYEERHGLHVVQGWGMTETSPVGTTSRLSPAMEAADADTRFRVRAMAGRPLPFVEVRARDESGVILPSDGETMGELEVRGPFVAAAYYHAPGSEDRFTDDGWFRTGDVATIDARGYVQIRDRAKDVIKSGGEWISSVALESTLMGHPAVAEASVVGLPHPRWDERPLALVVRREGCDCTPEELRAHLAPHFAKWWLPEAFAFVDAIPKTSVGKFDKKVMREQYRGYFSADTAPGARLSTGGARVTAVG